MRNTKKPITSGMTGAELAARSDELPITEEMITEGALFIFTYNENITDAATVAEKVYAAMYALDPEPARWKAEALECRERYGATLD